ncbi:5-formyltetrahydrofolate cyclo-ligase [Magnetospirillum molischianum]|uniref:5-formyltetrahydrofolate cyclo-ligase n=1 Tax=Magnetospirillum molischianum DSM 120 TaxID=1150626 RepID=H8FNW0_MAGML|nr:5-formyltetrahydrofolate cyclo-ligase [Magnetospirillum molischianum]CCG40048.1 Antifreeze protein, type I : 5-formyltetrahydrofolate cyclo-ligase [Magnetospirillum molischianum DSM 120]
MTSSPALLKQTLRREALQLRRGESARLGVAASLALAARADALEVGPQTIVGGYWPLPGEVDPRPLMATLAARGASLALPMVTAPDAPLIFRAWCPGDPLESGPHGTFHPAAAAPLLSPTLVLVPLLAFDAKGFRLGFGGGYYDRTLDALRRGGGVVAAGLAFAAQQSPALPSEPWDQPLDMVFTEEGLLTVVRA